MEYTELEKTNAELKNTIHELELQLAKYKKVLSLVISHMQNLDNDLDSLML
jgi:uncharacterized coiled-coil protein SlyX